MLKEVVHGAGSWKVKVGKVYCSVGTPLLRVSDVKSGDRLKVTLVFSARAKVKGRGHGARFKLVATGPVRCLAPCSGTFEGNAGWQSYVLVAYYRVRSLRGGAADGITFDLVFANGKSHETEGCDGRGRIREFVLSAESV